MSTATKATHTPGPHTQDGHDFNTEKYCTNADCHYVYHYSCADCGDDCTAKTDGGPATREIDGKTRCWRCNQKLTRYFAVGEAALVARAAPEMLGALALVWLDTPDHGDCRFCGAMWTNSMSKLNAPVHFESCPIIKVELAIRKARGEQ